MVTYQGKEYDVLPDFARKAMSENLSKVVSLYYSNHPEEYKAFLDWKEQKRKASEQSVAPT